MNMLIQALKNFINTTPLAKWLKVARIHNDFTNLRVPVYGITAYGGTDFGVIVGNDFVMDGSADVESNMDILQLLNISADYIINDVSQMGEKHRLVSLSVA